MSLSVKENEVIMETFLLKFLGSSVNNMNFCHVRMILAWFESACVDRGCEEMCQQADCSTLRITADNNRSRLVS